MPTTKLPQELYDNLCLRLYKNGKALNDNAFSTVRRKLESSARTTFDGVEVSTTYLKFAAEMLAHNVAVNGGKYASTLDKLVLFEIDEILNAPTEATHSDQGLLAREQPQDQTQFKAPNPDRKNINYDFMKLLNPENSK